MKFKEKVRDYRLTLNMLGFAARVLVGAASMPYLIYRAATGSPHLSFALLPIAAVLGNEAYQAAGGYQAAKGSTVNWLHDLHFQEAARLVAGVFQPGYWSIRSGSCKLPEQTVKQIWLGGRAVKNVDALKMNIHNGLTLHEGMQSHPITTTLLHYLGALLGRQAGLSASQVTQGLKMLRKTVPVYVDMISAVGDDGVPSMVFVIRTSYEDSQPSKPAEDPGKNKVFLKEEPQQEASYFHDLNKILR